LVLDLSFYFSDQILAAVLAGLDITMFIEFHPSDDLEWQEDYRGICRLLKFLYYSTIVSAFCANLLVVAQTTLLSVLGGGLALRGPDGSMMTATDGLYIERRSVFQVFGVGLALTIASLLPGVFLLLRWEAALLCWIITFETCRRMYKNYLRVRQRFTFDESETVDFNDIFDGPANIRGVSRGESNRRKGKVSSQQSRQLNQYRKEVSPPSGGDNSSFRSSYSEEDVEMQPMVHSDNIKNRRKADAKFAPIRTV